MNIVPENQRLKNDYRPRLKNKDAERINTLSAKTDIKPNTLARMLIKIALTKSDEELFSIVARGYGEL